MFKQFEYIYIVYFPE